MRWIVYGNMLPPSAPKGLRVDAERLARLYEEGPVAQQVEHGTFNPEDEGSSPSRSTVGHRLREAAER